jgi:hypothetical protein
LPSLQVQPTPRFDCSTTNVTTTLLSDPRDDARVPPAFPPQTARGEGFRVKRRTLFVFLALPFVVAACDKLRTKADVLKKAQGVKTKADLEKALGPPSDVDKAGPAEKWTYKCSDGVVVFLIVADRVVFDATGSNK